MTAQAHDTVVYRDEEYALVGINGEGLFEPDQHGLRPVALTTACWRGYRCTYEIRGQWLRLETLIVASAQEAPRVFSVLPTDPTAKFLVYEDIGQIMPFTGGLLLGTGFIEDLYVHMGFHPGWKYRKVHELIIENGRVVQEADRSGEMSELRRWLAERPLKPGVGTSGINNWSGVRQAFDRRYAVTIEQFQQLQEEIAREQAEENASLAERLKKLNAPAEKLAGILQREGLTCPHCHRHTKNMRVMGFGVAYFVCRLCGRSFDVEDLG